MKIPDNMTEEEVVQIIDNVANRLCKRFRFGYHTTMDIKQQACLEAVMGLEKYDGKRPLENFLWVLVKNRLINYKRDNYERASKPCEKCPLNAFDKENTKCMIYPEDRLEDCEFYYKWIMRNIAKRNLMDTIELENVEEEYGRPEQNMSDTFDLGANIDYQEVVQLLKQNMPQDYYPDLLRLLNNVSIPPNRKKRVRELVIKIMKENGYFGDNS